MADNAERRYRAAMDKLFLSSSKQSTSCTGTPSGSGSKQGAAQSARSELYQRTPTGQQRNKASMVPICRPWDRGDLMRRLATFKSITWFAKPKVVSPVNCARRGWINVEADTLACEACGSRLLFSTPSSWTSQQVENSAAVFSLKLDSGHKSICPWKDNVCEEHLTQFPPTLPAVLVETFRDRCEKLSHLSALPIVSSLAAEYMKGPQLDRFLAQSSPPFWTIISEDVCCTLQRRDLEEESASTSADIYHKSQKIISLCGWEPRMLPYVVDCQDQTHSAEDVLESKISRKLSQEQNPSIPVITGVDKVMEQDENNFVIDGEEIDPASVVLDCTLCGACVGLWAFSTVCRPLQVFNLIQSPDTTIACNTSGISDTVKASLGGNTQKESLQTKAEIMAKGSEETTQDKGALNLNLTIAGGPPPTKQNFRAKVSLPVIGRHLKAGIWCSSDVREDMMSVSSLKDKDEVGCKPHSGDPAQSDVNKLENVNAGDVSLETMGTLKRKRGEDNKSISNSDLFDVQSIFNQDPIRMENSSKSNDGDSALYSGMVPNNSVHSSANAGDDFCTEQTIEPVQEALEDSSKGEAIHEGADDASDTTKAAGLSSLISECCHSIQGNSQNGKDGQMGGISSEDFAVVHNHTDDAIQAANGLDCGIISAETEGISTDTSHCLVASSHSEDNAVEKEFGHRHTTHSGENATSMGNEDAGLCNPAVVAAVNNANCKFRSSGGNVVVMPWDKTMEFDPIRQHRHFCPWITSSGSGNRGLAGWQLTLSALEQRAGTACEASPIVFQSTRPRYEGEDPIALVRKLFHSGSAKRLRRSH